MNQEVLKRMGFRQSAHNEIFYDHLEVITEFLELKCPIDSKKAISMLRGSTGISERYVKEHIKSLLAWDIIKIYKGNYEWMLGKKLLDHNEQIIYNAINGKSEFFEEEEIKEYTVCMGEGEELKPCKYRPKEGDCNPMPGKIVKICSTNCNPCTMREE